MRKIGQKLPNPYLLTMNGCMHSYQPEGWLDPHTVLAPDAHTHTPMHMHIHTGTHS